AGRSRPVAALRWQPMAGIDGRDETRLEPLLSIEDVAGVLRISERGVYRLLGRGELTSVKVGNRTLIEPEDVRQFIASQRRVTAAASGRQVRRCLRPSSFSAAGWTRPRRWLSPRTRASTPTQSRSDTGSAMPSSWRLPA